MLEILDEAGYESTGAPTAEFALGLLVDPDLDLVVSDVVMPGLSGLELLEEVRTVRPALPVVLVTGAGTYSTLSEALARGADGLVIKPFSHGEFLTAIAAALERSGRAQRDMSERLLAPSLAMALANAIEARDAGTHGHCERLTTLAVWIAAQLGLGTAETEIVRLGAILHDVGKIGIPDRVLLKPGPLTAEELELMRTHPQVGDRVLEPLELLSSVRPVVLHHHERWDGDGYPDGLAAEASPCRRASSRLADAIEAMSAAPVSRGPVTGRQSCGAREGRRSTMGPRARAGIVARGIRSGGLGFTPSGIRGHHPRALPRSQARSLGACSSRRIGGRGARTGCDRAAFDDVRVVHAEECRPPLELSRTSVVARVLDHNLPDGSGLELLDQLRAADPDAPVVMMTGNGSEALAVEAFRQGRHDYVVGGACRRRPYTPRSHPSGGRMMIRLIVAEDHFAVRAGLVAYLDEQTDMEVVGEAENGLSACELVRELAPDLVLMDVVCQ